MVEKYSYIDKTEELALNKALSSLNLNKNEIVYSAKTVKKGIFGKKIEIEVYKVEDIKKILENKTKNLIEAMDIKPEILVKYKRKLFSIKVESDDNRILIGKNGEVLRTFRKISSIYCRRLVYPAEVYVRFDVSGYQKEVDKKLRENIKKIVEEVEKTKVPYKLDSMTSYERKMVYQAVAKHENLTTVTYGEDPNRYIVIKPKD